MVPAGQLSAVFCMSALQLGWVEGEETNLLLADPILTSRPDRERMAALMFETFNTAGYFVSDQAVLSLYSIGKLNGIVVDIGEQTTGEGPLLGSKGPCRGCFS